MPNYLRIVATCRNKALEKIEKNLGHRDITILREGDLINKKRKWFRSVKEKAYYIECVEYRGRKYESKEKNSAPSFSLQANLSPPRYKNQTQSPRPISTPINPLQQLISDINYRGKHTDIEQLGARNFSQPLNKEGSKEDSTGINIITQVSNPDDVASLSHKNVIQFLVARDFTTKFAKKISDYFDLDVLNNNHDYVRLAEHIATFFQFTGHTKIKEDQPHCVFVIGSTGVGKTTTLSKVASNFYIDENHYPKPSLIKFASLDAKRIMAMEQLRKFANILQVPFTSIYEIDDFKDLYKKAKKKELILIDTSGVSKQDTDLIDEIAVFTKSLKSSKEIHLCLTATGRYFDLKKTYEVLAKTNPDRILITKVDESYSSGSILSFIDEVNLPISYITNGQDVPIDIVSANKEQLKLLLLKEWGL